jgi:hypothetical protein
MYVHVAKLDKNIFALMCRSTSEWFGLLALAAWSSGIVFVCGDVEVRSNPARV